MPHLRRGRAFARLAPLCFLLLFANPLTARAQVTDATKLPAPLRSARDSMNKALIALDAGAAARFFADSASADVGGEVFRGQAGVSAWLSGQFQGLSAVRLQNSSFAITDNQVTERGGYTVTLRDGSGDQSGSTETIWAKQSNGSWRVIRFTVF